MSPEHFADRAAISDLVITYALALDTRDWQLLRSILTDTVGIDYSSHAPELVFELPAQDWIDMVTEGLGAFDMTQHLSTNHIFDITGDQALCRSQMQARHILDYNGDIHSCTLFGHYLSRCLRTAQGWKISHKTLNITHLEGDERVFGWAVEKFKAS